MTLFRCSPGHDLAKVPREEQNAAADMASHPPLVADYRSSLLVVELWGLGDLVLALPFIQAASAHARVTLLAKPYAGPLIQRFCPEVELVAFTAPWTAFRGKYWLHRWPWGELAALLDELRRRRFDAAVSSRPDPRDHLLMRLAGAGSRTGFSRAGSRAFLTDPLPRPASPHRFAHWQALSASLGWELPVPQLPSRPGRRMVIHTGAAQATRQWGRGRFEEIARRLRARDWQVELLDESSGNLPELLHTLDAADRFIGNDSGPGHLAARLGLPTFTIFGAQLSENFHPLHPQAAWIEGASCPHKPCNDYCRFAEPHCIRSLTVEEVWGRIHAWLG
jgi:ADP-heptose:LPS heptosyltransferase